MSWATTHAGNVPILRKSENLLFLKVMVQDV